MRRLNSVVVKLWLSIILIVTTVLLLLSGFLITFIQSYNTSNIGENLYNNAAKIERLMLNTHEKDSTIDYARELVEDPAGLIIIKNKKDLQEKSEDPLKGVMINEIRKNPSFNKVFRSNEHVLKEIKLTVNGEDHRYILLGYPSQAFQSDNAGIFLFQDINSIKETQKVITLSILIAAIILLIVSTVFAFFLSTRITKPLIQLKYAAFKVAKGHYTEKVPIYTRDEIGELGLAFNKMSKDIRKNIEDVKSKNNIQEKLINSMIDGVIGINDKNEVIISNSKADVFLNELKDFENKDMSEQRNVTFKEKNTQFFEYELGHKYYVVISTYIESIQIDGSSGIVIIIRDMTEEHHMDQMKKDFIASVSHELRTPISMLQGYTEAIVDGVVTEKKDVDDFLYIILDESKRLSRLVNELLEVAKMDAEGIKVSLADFNITTLINKIDTKFKPQAIENNLKLSVKHVGDGNTWYGDVDRIEQVLTNLIDNAIRYTHEEDSIDVIFDDSLEDYVQIKVKDTGVGIAKEHLEQIFDRFYKVDTSRTRGKYGTGLGLFIVEKIIDAHEGSIDVQSKEQIGTEFTITLPK
ncbi:MULTISPECIES: ATP-binding protein [Mammaliicoccus]|jgi:two-component system sensor histidine kinase ResE|uniref:Sensor protein SrrB n=1 Tax=Mammaliicoccus lentus TaxID=42858 RepID=A0AAP1WMH0_MAMLE|nr:MULTISPECIES: ATP-binding protein [Mammaliicoccus]MBF0747848.1 HAMP domain-containing protein [Mammaliicoccus lentus]MBF0793200.1 HAMP domain-containing protein [Mammaliicoccus lentus]MBF0842233.1 HAMP domain-containing protein [Mammaliicoccus lentus]MBU6113953.1 HAMP domain-containing protein [Mammaliicoccus lentus]MBW0769855.1 HAMP domain-containing protein [Mammaliicoccus lentus]